ncbi:MAG: hypothetical protein WBC49_03695 [Thermoplasmata archaeon]
MLHEGPSRNLGESLPRMWMAYAPHHMLLISAAAPTAICVYLLTRYFNGEEFYSGIHTLYLILIFGAIAVFGWTNYEVVRKRRKGLGYDA